MAQIATITVETAGGPVDLPVYEPGDSGSKRIEAFRVQTASGPGFVPLAAVDEADRPYLRVQTANGVKAVDTSASGIPDSVVTQYRFEDDSDTTTAMDSVESNDAVISGPTYTTDSFKGDLAISDVGSDGSDNRVESNTSVDLVTSGDAQAASVGGFIKASNYTNFEYPLSWGSDNSNNLSVTTWDTNTWRARLDIGGTEVLVDSGVSISSSNYQPVFAVVDQSELGIIVGSTLQATDSHSLDLTQIGSGTLKAIQGHTSQFNIFGGEVDDATYADGRLSEANVQRLTDR